MPAYGRKKACNSAGLSYERLLKIVCNFSARLAGKAAGQWCNMLKAW
jgi:hypothetical protein